MEIRKNELGQMTELLDEMINKCELYKKKSNNKYMSIAVYLLTLAKKCIQFELTDYLKDDAKKDKKLLDEGFDNFNRNT